jgi:hypothetical protein
MGRDQRRACRTRRAERYLEPIVDRHEVAQADRERVARAPRVGIVDRQLEPGTTSSGGRSASASSSSRSTPSLQVECAVELGKQGHYSVRVDEQETDVEQQPEEAWLDDDADQD